MLLSGTSAGMGTVSSTAPCLQGGGSKNARAWSPSFVMAAVLEVDGRALQSQRK